jgi:proteasome accessory factor C
VSAAGGSVAQLSRLLALIPWLLARPGVTTADAATEFGISPQQLEKDLSLAFMCGLPGHMPDDLIEVDFEGGRIHVSNADTIARPLRLGVDEAVALLVGLRALADVPGVHDRAALEATLVKLEQAAGDAAGAGRRVTVAVDAAAPVVPALEQALAQGRRLHLRYYVPTRDEVTERDVDPMRLAVVEGRSYLEAWCHLAADVRLFRVDRIEAAAVLAEPAQVPARAATRDLDDGLFQPAPDDALVVVDLERSASWVTDTFPAEDVSPTPDGRARVSLRVRDLAWAARLLLRLGSAAIVVAPAELADLVAERARLALDAYEPPDLASRTD